MDIATVLLLLRLFVALLLVAFFGLIAWFIYRDLQLAAESLAAAERPSGLLRVIANQAEQPAVGTVFPLLPLTSIGRASSNTIVLSDNFTSTEHALITRRNGQWWLQDRNSRNGTFLNESKVEGTAVISPGDIVIVGNTQLKVEFY